LPTDKINTLPNKAIEAPVMTFADEKVLFFGIPTLRAISLDMY